MTCIDRWVSVWFKVTAWLVWSVWTVANDDLGQRKKAALASIPAILEKDCTTMHCGRMGCDVEVFRYFESGLIILESIRIRLSLLGSPSEQVVLFWKLTFVGFRNVFHGSGSNFCYNKPAKTNFINLLPKMCKCSKYWLLSGQNKWAKSVWTDWG